MMMALLCASSATAAGKRFTAASRGAEVIVAEQNEESVVL